MTLDKGSRSHKMLTEYPPHHVTYAPAQFEVATYVQWLRRRCIYKKIHYLTIDLDPKVKVTHNIAKFPFHRVIYAPAQVKVATFNGLGDAITRNVMASCIRVYTYARTERRMTGRL